MQSSIRRTNREHSKRTTQRTSFDIRSNNQYKPVSRHFNQERHTLHDVNLTAVTLTTNDANVRLRTEEVWIAKLQTREPKGLNIIQ